MNYPLVLTQSEWVFVRTFMITRFNFSELEILASDIGISTASFRRETLELFGYDFMTYFARRNQLACLLEHIVQLRPDPQIAEILFKLPPCSLDGAPEMSALYADLAILASKVVVIEERQLEQAAQLKEVLDQMNFIILLMQKGEQHE